MTLAPTSFNPEDKEAVAVFGPDILIVQRSGRSNGTQTTCRTMYYAVWRNLTFAFLQDKLQDGVPEAIVTVKDRAP